MILSVVIPAYNEEKIIRQSLHNIKHALTVNEYGNFQWEIIVCDNNSTDQTAVLAAQEGASVVFEPINQISRARNKGAAIAEGDWLLFIDADSYPSPELMSEALDLIAGDQHIGCGSTVKAVDGPVWNRLRIERLNPTMRWFNWCGGAFLLCPKWVFEEIGGFSLELLALEEIDFVLKLKRIGRKEGKKFTVLHQHPMFTSARKGELSLKSILQLILSTITAVFYLLLYFILPKRIRPKANTKLLSFWYKTREKSRDS